MRVLIAGGAGFLGSHLCDYFVSKGHSVICVDSLITGSIENISQYKSSFTFKFMNTDMFAPLTIKDKIDLVLHFASPDSLSNYSKYPIETLKAGSIVTLNLLELAKAHKARFVLSSSAAIYGEANGINQNEDFLGKVDSVGLRSCYHEAKRFAEALTINFAKVNRLDARIARIANTYGPRMQIDDSRAISNFIKQALKNMPLVVNGDGAQTRSFCYVSDLVEGIYKLANYTEGVIKPVNLGSTEEISILQLAKKITSIVQGSSKIIFKERLVEDVMQKKPDISKAKKLLGWEPRILLDDGLLQAIKWFETKI